MHVCARLRVLTVVPFNIQVFCNIMPHGWASGSRCSSRALKLQSAYHWWYSDSRLVHSKKFRNFFC
jgi:hypothetical protein